MSSNRRLIPLTLLLLATTAGVLFIAPFIGATPLSVSRVFDRSIPAEDNLDAIIFHATRLPRVILGAAAGMILAVAGALMQSVLRNDLATPYTLGISGGAAVGALVVLQAGVIGGTLGTSGGALLGAAVAAALILLIARALAAWESVATLLLAGVTLNLLFGGVILVIQYRANPFEAFAIIRWLMGGLDTTDRGMALALLAFAGVAVVVGILLARGLDVLPLGDLTAQSLGVHPGRTRMLALGLAALGAALVVAQAGPIGFVGLIVPHAVRAVLGTRDHRFILPGCALLGAAFLVACDAAARVFGGGTELPVGVVTSLLGGPLFLVILLRRGGR